MIVVTSIGRSGTSMMIEYMSKIGFNCQMGNWYTKLKAGYESADSMIINQSFIKHHNMDLELHHVDWHREKILDIGYDAIKDPLFLALPEIIGYWWRARKDLRVMLLTRDHEEIAASQRAHPEMSTPTYRCFPDLMKKKEDQFFASCANLGIPTKVFDYNYLDFDQVYSYLLHANPPATFMKDQANARQEWAKLVKCKN